MKTIAIILSFLLVALLALFPGNDKRNKVAPPPEYNHDEDMVGPRGEEIFIGSGGGRYFIRDGKKIYVGYKGKKQHA